MNKIISIVIIAFLLLIACNPDEPIKPPKAKKIAYIVNYGAYSASNGSISTYDIEKKIIVNGSFSIANNIELGSNPQSMSIYKDQGYIMSNAGDKIDIVDAKDLKAKKNPISTNITKPRYFVAKDNTAYISCWGEVNDWTTMSNSYIAKLDLNTEKIEKIALPGGPEGVIIIYNKLYAALTTINKIAVINLDSGMTSYIDVPAIPQHFAISANGNLYVSLVSTYTKPYPKELLGIAIINPENNKVIGTINIPQISSSGSLCLSKDDKTLYAISSESYPSTNSKVTSIELTTNTIKDDKFIVGKSLNAIAVNPENDNIYLLIAPDATSNGTIKIYDNKGEFKEEFETGIFPQQVLFYDAK